MKKALYSITLLSLLITTVMSCGGMKKAEEQKINVDPYMTFEQDEVDFGNVKVGERPEHVYKFKNTSSEPITIEMVSGCDCTEFVDVPTGKAFMPGEAGSFKVIFKSETEEERGELKKTINILLENTDARGYQIVKEVWYNLILSD